MSEKPGYLSSIYNQFFASDDADVETWGDNMLDKMYKPGVVPKYIVRGNNNNIGGEDDDYISFWKSVSYYFAWIVIYARRIMDISNDSNLLFDYLKDRGIVVAPSTTLAIMQYVMENFYDEIRKRGSKYVFEKASSYPSPTADMLQINRLYGINIIDGEFLRAIANDYKDEFMVTITPQTNFGTSVDRCSYLYRGTGFDYQLIKGYENTDESVDLSLYPLINSPKVAIVNDVTIGKDVLEFSDDAADVGFGYVNNGILASVVWNIGLTGSSNIQIVDNTNGNTIGNAQWTVDLATLLSDLVASINTNTQDGALINGTYPFDNSAGYTAAVVGGGSPQPYDLTIYAPAGTGSSGNGINIGLYVDSGTWFVSPNSINGDGAFSQATSGGANNTVPTNKIVIDPAVNYEITCQVSVENPNVKFTMGADFFDEFGHHLGTAHIDGSLTSLSRFFINEKLNSAIPYYFVRAIIFGVNESTRASGDSALDIGFGKHIRIPCGARYVVPKIIRGGTSPSGINTKMFVYDFKVRIADTPYTRGYLQVPNAIQVWAKNNNGSYSSKYTTLNYVTHPISYNQVLTIPLLEEFARRYLIPYNSVIIFNWLGSETVCAGASYNDSYNDSYDT